MGVRPEEGGRGSLLLSHGLLSYQTRAEVMDDTIRRSLVLSFSLSSLIIPPSLSLSVSLQILHCYSPSHGPSDLSPLPPSSSLPLPARGGADSLSGPPSLPSILSPPLCCHGNLSPVPRDQTHSV